LIDVLTQFIYAVAACHGAKTPEARDRALEAWHAKRAWFWPKYRFPKEAVRNLADPATGWCSRKGFSDEKHVLIIENAAMFITALAKLTVPLSAYDARFMRNRNREVEQRWERQSNFLVLADEVRDGLRQLAARTGEVWTIEKASKDRGQTETGHIEGASATADQVLTAQPEKATPGRGQVAGDKKNPKSDRPKRNPGQPSQDRQNDILAAIRAAGTPLTRPELVKNMRLKTEGKLGHHLAWMVAANILLNIPPQGYWPANQPIPE
jgi:hypothetical protein